MGMNIWDYICLNLCIYQLAMRVLINYYVYLVLISNKWVEKLESSKKITKLSHVNFLNIFSSELLNQSTNDKFVITFVD